MSYLYLEQGKYKEAQAMLEQVVSINKRHFQPNHPRIGHVSLPLAYAYMYLGEFKKSSDLFKEIDKIYTHTFGQLYPRRFHVLVGQGRLCYLSGDYAQAELLLQKAYTSQKEKQSCDCYRCLEYLGDLYRAKGMPQEAIRFYQEALNRIYGCFPKNSAHIRRICKLLYFVKNAKKEALVPCY